MRESESGRVWCTGADRGGRRDDPGNATVSLDGGQKGRCEVTVSLPVGASLAPIDALTAAAAVLDGVLAAEMASARTPSWPPAVVCASL